MLGRGTLREAPLIGDKVKIDRTSDDVFGDEVDLCSINSWY